MTPKEIAEAYWQAEMSRDIERILGSYNDDAILIVPGLGELYGKAEIRTFYQESIDRFPQLSVEIMQYLQDNEYGAFEWRSLFHDHSGKAFPSKGVNFIHTRDGQLQRVHVYFDSADLNT